MTDPVVNDAAITKRPRIRRSWYRRRLRRQRTAFAVVVATLLVAAGWQTAVSYFSSPYSRASQISPDTLGARRNVRKNPGWIAAHPDKPTKFVTRIPGVYPYSVVPGGVKDRDELRYAALRDYVVRRHYAHFDYNSARLIRATEGREVYLSYRIRDTVYWTRRKIRLHLGELLLTDGKITARARCGNQISDTAKPEVSDEEPAEDVLDQPVAAVESSPSMPIHPMLAPPDLPIGQPSPPMLFGYGFIFPYVPMGGPIPVGCHAGDIDIKGQCKPKPPVVPEPSTMLLLTSGLALVLWRYRRSRRPLSA